MLRLRYACALTAFACSVWCAVACADTTETAFDATAALRASQAVIGTRVAKAGLIK